MEGFSFLHLEKLSGRALGSRQFEERHLLFWGQSAARFECLLSPKTDAAGKGGLGRILQFVPVFRFLYPPSNSKDHLWSTSPASNTGPICPALLTSPTVTT